MVIFVDDIAMGISLVPLKADLHGTIVAYDCRMRFLQRALLAPGKNRIRFPRYQIACATNDILRVVRGNRKQVVGFI